MTFWVVVPEPITLVHPDTKEPAVDGSGSKAPPISFYRWICENVTTFPQVFGKGQAGLDASETVEELFQGVAPGTPIPVPDEIHAGLILFLDSAIWNAPRIARQYRPFMDAIRRAGQRRPEASSKARRRRKKAS